MDPIKEAHKGNVDFFKVAESKDILEARDDAYDYSVLIAAIEFSQFECAKTILKRWPQLLYVPDRRGNTALHWSVGRFNIEQMKFLIDGADQKLFRMVNVFGNSPLHQVILNWGSPEVVNLLIEADPEFDSIPANNGGETPQMMAVQRAQGKSSDHQAVLVKDLILKKIAEKEIERDLSIPLEHLALYRRIVKEFGRIVPANLEGYMAGVIGPAVVNFLATVEEMRIVTPNTMSEEKLLKWEKLYEFYIKMGLQASWLSQRISWFRDWLHQRGVALYPYKDEVAIKRKAVKLKREELADLEAELNMSSVKLKNAEAVYSQFDFKIISD